MPWKSNVLLAITLFTATQATAGPSSQHSAQGARHSAQGAEQSVIGAAASSESAVAAGLTVIAVPLLAVGTGLVVSANALEGLPAHDHGTSSTQNTSGQDQPTKQEAGQ